MIPGDKDENSQHFVGGKIACGSLWRGVDEKKFSVQIGTVNES